MRALPIVGRVIFLGAVAVPAAAQRRELGPAEQAAHVLSRLTFGARVGDLERVEKMGVDAWIAAQLRPEAIVDSTPNAHLAYLVPWATPVAELPELKQRLADNKYYQVPKAMTATRAASADTAIKGAKTRTDSANVMLASLVLRVRVLLRPSTVDDQLALGKLVMSETSNRQLYEVMVDFWDNHFSVYSLKMPSAGALSSFERDVIRPRAFGKFRDLLGAVAHSPAMLYYLDNHLSKASGLNENYARELLELHTMGVDAGYTQRDVIEVARALTGWGIDPPRPVPAGAAFSTAASFRFDSAAHDTSSKVVLGQRLAGGRGVQDGEDVLDILARHPSTARYIATKLVRRLVNDDPPELLVARAAATFSRTDGDIREVVRTIVTSDEFFARANFRAKVKTPYELIVSTRRALEMNADSTRDVLVLLRSFGQPTFGQLTPDGWPDVGTEWMNSGTAMQRTLFGSDVVSGKRPGFDVKTWPGLALSMKPASDQVEAVVRMLLSGVASPELRAALQSIGGEDGAARLREMVALTIASPDFQKR